MSAARLTAALLAPKGNAFPLTSVYANPLLDPIPARRDAPATRGRRFNAAARCRIAPDLHARLRILAARQGKAVRLLVESAVADYLAANGENCPCLRERASASVPGAPDNGCCRVTR